MCFKVKHALNLVKLIFFLILKNNSQCQCHTFTVLKKYFEKEKRGNGEVGDTGYIACSTI